MSFCSFLYCLHFDIILISKRARGDKMADYKKSYTLRINETLLDKIRVVAARNKRSINAQIEYLIQQCVEEFETKHGEIKIDEEKTE